MATLTLSRKQWPFAPQCINNCILWLDAADTSTYTPSSSISTWRNKGYAGGSATTTSGTVSSTSADINGLPAMNFATNSYMTAPSMTYTQTTRTAFVVVNIGSTGVNRYYLVQGSANYVDTALNNYYSGSYTDIEFSYYTHVNYQTTTPYPIFNTTSIICGTTLSTNGGIFVNGLAQTPYAINSPLAYGTGTTTTQLIGYSATGSFVLGEVMIFDGAITDIQRQQVEGYLAQKWGLQSLLPSTHPYFTLNNLLTPAFAPTEIPTCALWLDASDATSITGTGVATWKDKSGNGYNATGVNAPVFVKSTGGVSFTAASAQYFTMSVPYSKTNTMFMVASPVPSTTSNMYYVAAYSGGYVGTMFLGGYNNGYAVYYMAENTPGFANFSTTLPTSPFLASAVKTSGVSYTGYYNGAQVFTGADGTSDTAAYWQYIGAAAPGNNYLTATIYEVIIYNVALTANQIQAVNAYLGAKWNIAEAGQGSIAPVVNPLAISGCQLWLDAADATTIVPVVSTWRDNSGLGNNMSLTAGTVTYVSNSGPPCVNFASGGILQTTNYISITSGVSVVFVVCQATAVTGGSFGYLIACTDINGGDTSIRFYPSALSISNSDTNDLGLGVGYYVNGVLNNSNPVSVPTGYNIIGTTMNKTASTRFSLSSSFPSGSSRYFVGNIREVIVYTGPLTTTQRLQVENYLMAKWGTGRNFWIDASDATTVTKGTTMVQWNDKSGNGYNLIPGSGITTYVPYSTYPSVKLNTSYMYVNKPVNLTQYTMFIAVLSQTAVNNQTVFTGRPNTSTSYSSPDGFGFYVDSTAPDLRFYYANSPITNYTSSGSISQPPVIAAYTCTSTGVTYSWVNGASGTSYTAGGLTRSSTAQGFSIGGEWQGSSYGNLVSVSNVYEIIVYNTVLTNTQVQQIQTYLGNKWGVTVSNPTAGITNPTLIPSCVLWLDAADPTTIITAVTQMKDKSGNGYNITQSTAVYQPTLTNNYLALGTSLNYYMNMPQAAINNTTSWTLFLVFNPSSSTNWIMVKQFDGNNTYNVLSMTNYTSSGGAPTTGTTGVLYFHAYNAGTLFTGPAALTTSVNQLLTLICNGTNIYYYINGVLALITNGSFAIQSQTGATNFTLGAWISSGSLVNSGVTNFQLGELDFYNSALPTIQTQQIEASLMNKWSITNTVQTANGSLIDTPFLPTDITGCVLWLDGADTSSITMTGTAVTAWADKSGTSHSATAFNSPTYSASSLGVVLNGTNNYLTSSVTVPTATHCLIAVCNPTTISGNLTGNTSLFRFQVTNYVVFPYMDGTTPRGYISNQDSTTTAYNSSVLVEKSVANTINVIAANISASSQTIYKNGVIQTTGAAALTNVTSDALTIGCVSGSSQFYSGTLYEMIVYNTTLTTAQFQAVTNYLQRKWNTALTVTTIPTPVYNRPFQPVDITGCQLWLDSADNTALALSGSNVTTWYDKSGNGNNGTATGTPVLTTNSINGRQSIYLADAPYFLGSVSITGTILTCFTVAITNVTMPNTRGRDQRLVSLENGKNVDYGRTDGTIALFNQNTTSTIATYRVSGPLANNAITTGTPFLAVSQYDGTNAYLWYTGAAGTLASSASSGTFAITKYGIGNQANPTTEYWNGYIGEVIIYNTALSTSQRQQVEAYLAWKWGFVTGTPSLPSTHPGKTLPSFSTVFSPKTISGLQMWLDGTDPNATGVPPANGTTVSTWYDKSGNGYNATVASGKIAGTYSTANSAIYCTASNTGYVTSYTAAPSLETMFVVFNNPSPSGNNNMVIGGPQGARSLSGGYAGGGAGVGAVSYLNNEVTWTGMASMPASTYTSGTTVIITGQVNGLTTSISQNGGTIYSNTTASAFTAGTTTYLGTDYYSASYYYIGYEMEVIFYNSLLTLSQRQQVEGYLAWKWGLASSLPTTHPFKKFAP